ncbi:MAG: right-handed parallel beta-helix repeat-containing protein [Candidatus Eisenbacteria bacterium]|nr:right-handed parallel beta-helix repeat-containing protein [Candidatus Eisenbacteria bacterium]
MGAPVSAALRCGVSSLSFLSLYLGLQFSAFGSPAFAGNTVAGEHMEIVATPTCLGVQWFISGDDNLTSTVEVQYRDVDASGPWRVAQPLLRVEPGSFNGDGVDPGNLLAGSVFDLTPNTTYELRLVLEDPDGGSATEYRIERTRPLPADPVEPRVRYVVPGSGGGSGTEADPFRGIAQANALAIPGDVFLLQPGTYSGVSTLSTSGTETDPIVWRGVDAESVVLDGEDIAKPVVDFPGSRYVHLEDVTVIRPRQMAIRGNATSGIVVRGCTVDSSNLTGAEKGGIYFFGPGQSNVYIADNTVRGPIRWEDGRNDDAYGIVVAGRGHVIRNNEIFDWWDGISVGHGETEVETSDCDVFSNEVYNCTDDGIETDGSRHNVRVVGNRFTNVLCGISAQPVYGGPMYAVRNVVYNSQLKPLKYHVWPTGLIVFNNTFVGADPRGWGDGQWRNAIVRNNLFLGGSGPGHSGDPISFDAQGERADLDYNGWRQVEPDRFARFNGTYYETLETFQEALDMSWHAVYVDLTVFYEAEEPELGPYLGQGGYLPGYVPGSQDLRLSPGSVPEDAGVMLANITEGYDGAAPDLGAYETGLPFPIYGPRTEEPGDPSDVTTPSALAAGPTLVAYPNPFSAEATIDFAGRLDDSSALRVYAVDGRLVRTLDLASRTTQSRVAIWDGRDEFGRDVGDGIFFLRLEDSSRNEPIAQTKVIRVD